jgi:hypothetical protein
MLAGVASNILYDMSAPSVENFIKNVKGYKCQQGMPFLSNNRNYHNIFTKTNYWWEN